MDIGGLAYSKQGERIRVQRMIYQTYTYQAQDQRHLMNEHMILEMVLFLFYFFQFSSEGFLALQLHGLHCS